MADLTDIHYIYPPNFQDAPNTYEHSGTRRVIVQLGCVSDGTGETDVVKIDLSELRMPDGTIPTRSAVERLEYDIRGMRIGLEWDRAPHAAIAILSEGQGFRDFRSEGGKVDPGVEGDRTGDIILTSDDADDGDNYDITIWLRLKA